MLLYRSNRPQPTGQEYLDGAFRNQEIAYKDKESFRDLLILLIVGLLGFTPPATTYWTEQISKGFFVLIRYFLVSKGTI
jgi:hypothetical protein